MRLLVTGGSGFIGSAVVDLLSAEQHEVVVLDAARAHENRDATYIVGDVRDRDVVRRALRGVDAVSHHAAMVGLGVDFADVSSYVSTNDLGTAVLLEELHRVAFRGRIVLAGSMVVYGEGRYRCGQHGVVRPQARSAERLADALYEHACPDCGRDLVPEPITEHDAAEPWNVYAATKLHQEHLCRVYGREHASSWISLRYHNVYGPRMPRDTPYAGVAAIFCSAIARGERPLVFEDGGQRRDFVHVDDVARANLAALTAPRDLCGAFNIASGTPRSVLELAEGLCAASAEALEPAVVGGYRLGDVRHVFASPTRARDHLGFTATTDFASALTQFAKEQTAMD